MAPGSGPPMHVHRLQEEVLTVQSGTMGWQRPGEEEHTAHAGETVTFAPGETHRFWNAGDDELVGTGYVRPPDNLEYYLTQIFTSMREQRRQASSLLRRRLPLVALPLRVRDDGNPAARAALRLPGRASSSAGCSGAGRRFDDAPEPVSR